MQHKIEVNGIALYAYHGCLDEEKNLGGKYTVSVTITTDFSQAFQSDELKDTVDYVAIRKIVVEEMAIRSKLIEHVGYRIIKRLKNELLTVLAASVKVVKHNPPIGGVVKDVVVVIED